MVQWVLKLFIVQDPRAKARNPVLKTNRNSSRNKEAINFLQLKNLKKKRTAVTFLEKVAAAGLLGYVALQQNIATLNCFIVFLSLITPQLHSYKPAD